MAKLITELGAGRTGWGRTAKISHPVGQLIFRKASMDGNQTEVDRVSPAKLVEVPNPV